MTGGEIFPKNIKIRENSLIVFTLQYCTVYVGVEQNLSLITFQDPFYTVILELSLLIPVPETVYYSNAWGGGL